MDAFPDKIGLFCAKRTACDKMKYLNLMTFNNLRKLMMHHDKLMMNHEMNHSELDM